MRLRDIFENAKPYDGKRFEKSSYGNNYIYNPTIMDIEAGNMIRIHGNATHKNYDKNTPLTDWGNMVSDVDYKKQMVLVGEYMGGTKEFSEWVSINDVKVTWNIGGYDRAMKLIGDMNAEVGDVLNAQDEVSMDREIEKQVKFKR